MKHSIITSLLFLCISLLTFNSNAAYLENVPVEVRQPNGQVLKCFATGDEFHNWLHDKNNYTIVRNKQTGYYVYAILKNGVFSASDYVAGQIDPASVGINPGLNTPNEKTYLKSAKVEDKSFAPTSGDLNNIVIYIRFADQAEFTTTQTSYEGMFNGTDYSLSGYFHEVSGGQLNVHTTFYPSPQNDFIVSYQDIHPRDYYVPYDAIGNPIGYLDEEATEREHALLENAIESVKATLEGSAINFDSDADRYVDNVCFIVQGATEGWSDLLWPHKWALFTRNVTIAGNRVWEYNFQLSARTNVSVLCHEMFHTLGAPDLYHYDSNFSSLYPVAGWDLMANDAAQHTLTWMKFKYGKWMDEVPEIFGQGTYKLPAVGNNPFACYKIRVPESADEFFMVEYRKRVGYDAHLSGGYDEGLLVYRVNANLNGNAWGPPDELYVLRPGVTVDIPNGRWYDATLSENQNRNVINAFSDPLPLLADGSESSLSIYDVGLIGDSIEFKVGDPVITSDTLEIIQLLPQNPAILSVNDTVHINFYYQTTGENILIDITPMSSGQEVAATISDQSNVFSEKMGVGERKFYCTTDCLVDELRFRFLNSSTQNILYETYVPVYYRFVEDSIQFNLETDSLALVALYNACNGTGWNINTNWLSNEPLASWYGITVENERVTGLELFSDDWSVRFGLQGELPDAIGNLTKLKTLNFQGNELSGSIPLSMGRLLELETLNLVHNNFSGELPAILGNLVFLKNLILYANNLSGEIPIELSNLTELTYLNLGANNFSGSFGEIIGNLTQLQTLYLSYNNFTGNLPVHLGSLQNLYSLYLSGNYFNGEIPNELYGMQNLRYLNLDYNELSGELPEAIGNLANLWSLGINDNLFDGELPVAIGNLSNLHYLFLHNNNFSGTLPDELCTIPLFTIQLGANDFDSSSCPVVSCLIDNGVELAGDLTQQSGYSLADCIEKPDGYAINEHSQVYTDTGMFYDSGFDLNYSDNESDTITFFPLTDGAKLSFNFLEFSTEDCCDYLRIYDGTTIDESTLIGEYKGTYEFLEQVVASNPEGALTFYFYSDGSVTDLGWKAEISVLGVVDSSYTLSCNDVTIENGTITSCSYDFSNTDIIIPDALCDQLVTGIGNNVFSSKGITSVKMPSTLVSIGTMAFQSNPFKKLDLSICSGLTYIGSYAFANSFIEELWLPGSLEILGTACFSDNHMTHLNGVPFDGIFYQLISGSVDSSWVNSYGGLSDVVEVPAWVQTVGAWAYSGADLTEVVLNQGLENIQYQAFSRNRLTVINLPDLLYFIGNNAFEFNSLASILIPRSVVNIGRNAFGFNNLVEVVFEPKSNIALIDVDAFADNSSLVSIALPTHASQHFLNYFDNLSNIYYPFDTITDFSLAYTSNIDPDLGCPQYFHPVWEGGNPNDPMNIFIIGAKIDGENLVAGDQIGVFDGDLCVGYGKVVQTLNDTAFLSLVAGSDDGSGNGFTPGHEISYRIWRCNDSLELEAIEIECFNNQFAPVPCSAFQSGASSFVQLNGILHYNFATGFQPGWNLFSMPVLPDSSDLMFVFNDLISQNSLLKLQDETGATLEDLGVFGGWQNAIGEVQLTEGYKVKVTEYDSLFVSGLPASYPFPIPLSPGWNIMGFPGFSIVDGMEVVQQLIVNSTLIKVQNEQGRSIEDLGIYGGWQNFVGNFEPGEGYKIKVNSPDTLWIEENYPKSLAAVASPIPTQHFKTGIAGNGVDHMNFNIVALPSESISKGDEIAIYDGNICVGANVINENILRNRIISIPASAADDFGLPGFMEGNIFSIRIWSKANNREAELKTEFISGPKVFTKHESVILSLEKSVLTNIGEFAENGNTEVKCYPNPFRESVTIELTLGEASEVSILVLNQLGQSIRNLFENKPVSEGIQQFSWDGRNQQIQKVTPGIYYLQIRANNQVLIAKVILK